MIKYLAIFLTFLVLISALPNNSELLANTFEKRNDRCSCKFVTADFDDNGVVGLVSFAQDEEGNTHVAGIFSKGFDDKSAHYGLIIVNECRETLFDLSDGLNIQPDGSGGTKSFRHKFPIDLDCTSEGMLTKKIHNSKRHGSCSSSKLRKRLPNGAMTTQNGQGTSYAGLT